MGTRATSWAGSPCPRRRPAAGRAGLGGCSSKIGLLSWGTKAPKLRGLCGPRERHGETRRLPMLVGCGRGVTWTWEPEGPHGRPALLPGAGEAVAWRRPGLCSSWRRRRGESSWEEGPGRSPGAGWAQASREGRLGHPQRCARAVGRAGSRLTLPVCPSQESAPGRPEEAAGSAWGDAQGRRCPEEPHWRARGALPGGREPARG